MQLLFDSFIRRFSHQTRDRLQAAVAHQNDLNPIERMQKGVCLVLKEYLAEKVELQKIGEMKIDVTTTGPFAGLKRGRRIRKKKALIESKIILNKQTCFHLACLSCYITQQMKATEEYCALLKQIDHMYIDAFIAFFEETPSNYQETLEKIDEVAEKLSNEDYYDDEMKAHIIALQTGAYGQKGDIAFLKNSFKYLLKRLPQTENVVEIRGLQDIAISVIWWSLHSGSEANIDEMVTFIEPFILKYKLYMSFTDYLNLKGAIASYFGDNDEGIRCFEILRNEYEMYNDNYRLSIAIGNLAESYFAGGKIVLAKSMLEEAIKLYFDSTGKWPYLYLTELGNIYYITEDERAEELFLQAYDIQKKEKSLFKGFILYELVHFYLRTEQNKKAERYLAELISLAKDLQALSINVCVEYLRGFSELANQNFSSAIEYLQTALELARETGDMDLILTCNIQMAAANLQKYRFSEQQTHLTLALNHIDTAIKLAIENGQNQILTIGLMIRSLLLASIGEFASAEKDITEAKEIGAEIDLDKWKEDIVNIESTIKTAHKEGKMELDRESVFKYIIPQFKSMLSFKLVERKPVKANVIGLLVITESGVPIYSNLDKSIKTNQLILSGLLAAINQLSSSILDGQEKGRLQEVLYDNFWITVQPLTHGIVAVIASDATAEIRMWASDIADRIKEVPITITEFTDQMVDKIGDLLEQMDIK
ncbi:MAG: tetratricopeptide repeat protein [Candidatus Heimdallarchaeota archaeon]